MSSIVRVSPIPTRGATDARDGEGQPTAQDLSKPSSDVSRLPVRHRGDPATPTTQQAGASEPRPSIKPLYSGDNGRIVCGDLRCAGSTAHFSGMKRDLSGQRMRRMTLDDVREWDTYGLGPMKCERCGAEASVLL